MRIIITRHTPQGTTEEVIEVGADPYNDDNRCDISAEQYDDNETAGIIEGYDDNPVPSTFTKVRVELDQGELETLLDQHDELVGYF